MQKLMSKLLIEKHQISAEASAELSAFINEPLFISSDQIDLSETPSDIACLPFVYNLAPIAWRLGGEWVVDELSEKAAENLEQARKNMSELWPEYEFSGTIHGKNKASKQASDKAALLFSGGLDSTFTAMQILDQKPTLITIHGGRDLQLQDENAWAAVENATASFSNQHDLDSIQIKSNFTVALTEEVDKLCPGLPASWWASIQHGMGLSGVAAPVIYANGNNQLYISATHTTGHQQGWGSHPKLDGILDWGAAKVNHFGYDHDRTLKIKALKELATEKKMKVPELIVCTRRNRQGNCMRCPKCLRTMGSVLVNDYDPQEFGFGLNKNDAKSHLMGSVPTSIKITDNEIYAWRSISNHAKENLGAKPDVFMKWLAKLDLAKKPGFFERLVNRK
jgi:hypothetical protein